MLEVIGAGNPDYKGQDWGDVWANSPEYRQLSEDLEDIISSRRDSPDSEKTKDDREYAMPLYAQIQAVTKRAFVAYWRLPDYILVCLHILLISIVTKLTSGNRGNSCFTSSQVFSTPLPSGIWATATSTCNRDCFLSL